ncbi:MAG: hypothetical protein JNM70_11860 [Anaerolineae bacterium]|nr:hypothetical protein [Anaerolineae bacterium]
MSSMPDGHLLRQFRQWRQLRNGNFVLEGLHVSSVLPELLQMLQMLQMLQVQIREKLQLLQLQLGDSCNCNGMR